METLVALATLLLLQLSLLSVSMANPSTAKIDFVKVSCAATRYPTLCVQSLSVYAAQISQSPRQMAQTALAVSLAQARSASAYMAKLSRAKGMKARDRAAMKDCLDNMGLSVEELTRSVRELSRPGRAGTARFLWHVSNVQTWVSAALTDENTCVDGFVGPESSNRGLKVAVRARISQVAQVTSNALALINRSANN